MSSPLDQLLETVRGAIQDHAQQQKHTGFDPTALLGKVGEIFGAHQRNASNVKPASEDPYGDPANQAGGAQNGRGASNVKPASEDPYGDPADQERRR